MRFCDLFVSYKIGLKEIKSTIPFTKLPLYRKIAAIVTFAITVISALLFALKLNTLGVIALCLCFFSLIVFYIIDSNKNNLDLMLKEHYLPYSKKRMNMVIDVLKTYKLDFYNSDVIDLLIEEAQKAQIQSDFLLPLKKPLKVLTAVIFPVVAYALEKIGDAASQDELIAFVAQIIVIGFLIFSLIVSLVPVAKDLLYRDYNKYDELIYDLRQIKLFCTKKVLHQNSGK